MNKSVKEMKSPYETLNYFYLDGIPFLPLSKRGNSVNCRIGQSKQLVFIPFSYFNDDLTLKENADLSWFMKKRQTQCKIKLQLRKTPISSAREVRTFDSKISDKDIKNSRY